MKGRTLTRADLAEAVYQEVGLSRSESAELVDSILTEISDSLVDDGVVKISSFGTFSVRQKGRRVGRNPKTGEEVPIMPRRVLVFRASQVLKDRINGHAVAMRRTRRKTDGTLQQTVTPRAPAGSAPAAAPASRQPRFGRSARSRASWRWRSTCCASGRASSRRCGR